MPILSARTSLVVVANTVSRFDGTTSTLEVCVLGQVQPIRKGCGQEALAAWRKESAADREAWCLLAECLGLLGSGLSSGIAHLAEVKQADNAVIATRGQNVPVGMEAAMRYDETTKCHNQQSMLDD
jgi:hypothetical protein